MDAIAGLTLASGFNEPMAASGGTPVRENPFNTPGMAPAKSEDCDVVVGNAMLSGSQWEEPSHGDVVPGDMVVDSQAGQPPPVDVNAVDNLMDLSGLSLNSSSGFVAPSTTPAMPGLLDSTAADAAMAVAMAAAATLHGGSAMADDGDEEEEGEGPGSPSSALSDLSDS